MSKILKIGLIMQGGLAWMGGTEYIKNIVLALSSLPPETRSTFEVCLICSKSFDPKLYDAIKPHLKEIYYQEEWLNFLNFKHPVVWNLIKNFFFHQKGIDFVYPNVINYLPIGKSCCSAGWFTDFQYKYLPDSYTKKDIAKIENLLKLISRKLPTVVLSSKTAESDFHKFFPQAALKSEVLVFRTYPISTWYEADSENIQKTYSLPERFFIISNQFWRHKNHLVVFEALKLLQEKSIYPMIVCTGNLYDHRQPNYSNIILEKIHKLGLAKQVNLLGLIPRLDQIQLMRRSLAVIQPSFFEGWSTVVEDARCLGKPILLSNIPVHVEQDPPNSLFFDPNSPESLASLIAEWLEHLVPGPDLEQEAIARTNNLAEVQAFGYRFLEIVKTSLSS